MTEYRIILYNANTDKAVAFNVKSEDAEQATDRAAAALRLNKGLYDHALVIRKYGNAWHRVGRSVVY